MFRGWGDFYLLIGPAAAALIGLLFVVATLTSGREDKSVSRGTTIYMTPTVFHFALVVLLSAVAVVPDVPARIAGAVIAAGALAGLIYAVTISVQLRRADPAAGAHWSDFWCYGAVPTLLYLCLVASAVLVWQAPPEAPYGVAVVLLALLLTGIRNAWDLVTWLAPRRPGG